MRPSVIKVGAHDFTVSYEPVLEGDAVGLCSRSEQTIRIRDSLKGSVLAETLLHEVMHAVYCYWNVTHSESGDSATEEASVNGLASGLACVFRDNPDFLKFLQRSLK